MKQPLHPRRSVAGTAVLAIVLALAAATPAVAQQPRGLTFVAGLAYEQGGPGPALVDALAAAGLDHTKEQRQAPTIEHPYYLNAGLSISGMVGFRYRFERPFSVEALAANGARGHAEGYNSMTREQLVVGQSALLITCTGGLHLGPLRLGLGPAANVTAWRVTHNITHEQRETTTSLGGVADLSVGSRVGDVLLSLRAGAVAFPMRDLRPEFSLPIQADYRSFFLGVTVLPWER